MRPSSLRSLPPTRLALSALVLLATAVACSSRGGVALRDHVDPDSTIEVAAGEEFRLVVRSNHSTGYRWLLADTSALGPLELVGETYENEHPDRVGAAGWERWHFRATAPGEGTVLLHYRRPWEEEPPAETREYHVRVR